MDKSYVQQYGQLENSHWWFIIRRRIILQSLQKFIPPVQQGKLKILNAGAAAGGSSQWLSALGEVVSLEQDPLFLSYLADQQIEVIDASVTNIPLADNSFDLVCAFDVIEHVDDDQLAVSELLRVCKPGGHLCITVPAFQSLWGNHDVVNGHRRRYKKNQLQALFKRMPATERYISYFNSLLFIPVFLFRKMQSLFSLSSAASGQSDFIYFKKNDWVNGLLKKVFGAEVSLSRFVKFPVGVSLLMIAQKEPMAK